MFLQLLFTNLFFKHQKFLHSNNFLLGQPLSSVDTAKCAAPTALKELQLLKCYLMEVGHFASLVRALSFITAEKKKNNMYL